MKRLYDGCTRRVNPFIGECETGRGLVVVVTRSRLLTIVLALVVALGTAALAGAAPPPANLDSSVLAGNEAEDAIAVNPTNPSNVVTMSSLSDAVAGLSANVTFDGGATWTRQVIGTSTSDPLGDICCDEQLAWDGYGNLWMTYLLNSNGDVLVALSTDGGLSFRKVAEVVTNSDQPSISVGANSVWISYSFFPGKQIQAFGVPVTGLGKFGSKVLCIPFVYDFCARRAQKSYTKMMVYHSAEGSNCFQYSTA